MQQSIIVIIHELNKASFCLSMLCIFRGKKREIKDSLTHG